MESTNALYVQAKWLETRKSGPVRLAGRFFTLVASKSGHKMKALLWLSSNCQMEICLRHGNGDVLVAIFLKTSFLLLIPVGVKRRLILDQFQAFLHTHVVRHAVNIDCCQRNAHIHVSYYVMLVHVLLAHILVLFRAASVGKDLHPEDALTQITILGGTAVRSVATSCHVENTAVGDLATRVSVVLVR